MSGRFGIVVIGRNEAPRLELCLRSIAKYADRTVYVDSGSIDGSAEIAERLGVVVIRLREGPFTAARGRRSGLEFLRDMLPDIELVQFIDGDCELAEGWLDIGQRFLASSPSAAAVVGRLREKHSDRSLLVRLTDLEWQLPIGPIDVIGGISLMRITPLLEVGGWKDGLTAGEELDLSTRLRDAGWTLHRLPEAMCTHDVGITRFREFWKRSLRAGYGYTNLSIIHQKNGPRRWFRRAVGSVFYGMALPMIILGSAILFWPASLACALLYLHLPLRLAVNRLRLGDSLGLALAHGGITTLCKTAMAMGVLKCLTERTLGRSARLIEYKRPTTPAAPARATRS